MLHTLLPPPPKKIKIPHKWERDYGVLVLSDLNLNILFHAFIWFDIGTALSCHFNKFGVLFDVTLEEGYQPLAE